MEFYIWGDYLFNSIALGTLINDNWKGGLKEGKHFFKITTSSELTDFEKTLDNSFIDSFEDEKNKILSVLKNDLTPKELEDLTFLVLSAKDLRGNEKFLVMKKAQKYVKGIGNLNTIFGVNKDFFNNHKKEQEEK